MDAALCQIDSSDSSTHPQNAARWLSAGTYKSRFMVSCPFGISRAVCSHAVRSNRILRSTSASRLSQSGLSFFAICFDPFRDIRKGMSHAIRPHVIPPCLHNTPAVPGSLDRAATRRLRSFAKPARYRRTGILLDRKQCMYNPEKRPYHTNLWVVGTPPLMHRSVVTPSESTRCQLSIPYSPLPRVTGRRCLRNAWLSGIQCRMMRFHAQENNSQHSDFTVDNHTGIRYHQVSR